MWRDQVYELAMICKPRWDSLRAFFAGRSRLRWWRGLLVRAWDFGL